VVVVEGPAGIGKSELLGVVGGRAGARGFGVLRARGSEFEAGMAFGVARQLFEPVLRAAASRERGRLLDGVAGVGARALGVEAGEPPADRFAAITGCSGCARIGLSVVRWCCWSMMCSGSMIRRWRGLVIWHAARAICRWPSYWVCAQAIPVGSGASWEGS
jgi:hypothetical protein